MANMNYFALFLDNESYIEKCLILIKHISNPESKSLPHITLRVFKELDQKTEYIKNKRISYLNVIEPGSFNMETPVGPYVIYLKCESEELEEIDYRPDYPFSRLHITLYEGNDPTYASSLLSLLKSKISWHFKLDFDRKKHLSEQALGSKSKHDINFFNSIWKEVLGENYAGYSEGLLDNTQKLKIVDSILVNLANYLNGQYKELRSVKSLYSDNVSIKNTDMFFDESRQNNYIEVDRQLIIDGFPESEVIKPVQDAIYVTPPEYARDMAQCGLEAFGDDNNAIAFGDSAIGTGALFIALKRQIDIANSTGGKHYSFCSAIGVDIEEKMAKEAFFRCSKRNLLVIYGDAVSPQINLRGKRNLMIVNPPYNRHEDIPDDYRKQLKASAEEQTGISVPANSGLYVYHLLIMDKWLDNEGIAVWLIPSIFLQSRYGVSIRKYLTENVQLLRLHIYDEETLQFSDAKISTTIVVFKKKKPSTSSKVFVTYGTSIDNPYFSKELSIKDLKDGIKNWRNIIFSAEKSVLNSTIIDSGVKFSSIFEIKRGIATGANTFFVMKRNDAKKHGIPEFALKPILPKARYLKSLIIESEDDGYPTVDPQLALIDCDLKEAEIKEGFPQFYSYLQGAKEKDENDVAIIDRTLIKQRTPWYKQEHRDPALFLLTYMGRSKSDLPPLYFILNRSNALALNTYILLYPKPWLQEVLELNDGLCETLLSSLNTFSKDVLSQRTRRYSGGLQKLEPNELKELHVTGLPIEVVAAYRTYEKSIHS